MVVGVLVQGPVAVQDVAGIDVLAAETILHRLTVVAEFHHLAFKVGLLVDADTIRSLTFLVEHKEKTNKL